MLYPREDYAVVYRLMAAHLAVDVEAAVTAEIRETVQAVQRLSEGGEKPVTLTTLAQELGLDKSSVSRRAGHAIHARLLPGDELPGAGEVLPSPEQLWPRP